MPRLVELQVLDAREEDASGAHDRAARLEQHLVAAALQPCGELLAIAADVERRLVAVADADASAQVDVLEADALALEARGELEHAVERFVERPGLEDLRADVAIDAGHAQVRELRRAPVDVRGAVVR